MNFFKNQHIRQIVSWLEVMGITPIQRDQQAEELLAIPFNGPEGQRGEYHIILRDGTQPPEILNDCCFIPVPTLKDTKATVGLLMGALQKAGYETSTIPVFRPKTEERPPAKEHLDDVVFRHVEFRRCPNPPESVFLMYKPTIDAVCSQMYGLYKDKYLSRGYTKDDLHTYAMVWVCNFFGLYQMPSRSKEENMKLLYSYLKQRFYQLLNTLMRVRKSIGADYDTVAIAVYDEACYHDHIYTTHPYLNEDDPATTLIDRLASLPHRKLLRTLQASIKKPHLSPETRKLIKQLLVTHRKDCETCQAHRSKKGRSKKQDAQK